MFKQENRLTKKKEFDQIFKTGRSSYQTVIGVKAEKNSLGYNKYGIIVSNKISKKAVVRNRIKRQIRAALEAQDKNMKQGFDLIILALPGVISVGFTTINQAVIDNLKKLRLL